LAVSLIYLLALWGYNYHDYHHLDQLEAIDGRYLLSVLIVLYAALALGVQKAVAGIRQEAAAKIALGFLLAAMFTVYGGCVQYAYKISPLYGGLNSSTFQTL
jgi:hypothetical protein